jgi:5-methyltetrahydropteroyltriglutamate--homocysteine methyltransferase
VSALSLLYPADGIDGYPKEQFLDDLVAGGVADIRRCLDAGAYSVQIDFTEGRLSLKLDPSGDLLRQFLQLNSRVISAFTSEERARIGVHTFCGLPSAGLSGLYRRHQSDQPPRGDLRGGCQAIIQAAQYIPVDQLGTTDDCGFSPFGDDDSTSRDIAFAKVAARIKGTRAASDTLNV